MCSIEISDFVTCFVSRGQQVKPGRRDKLWDFIENHPMAQRTEIFMLDTLGGFSGGIVGPIRRKVKNRGYKPIGACEIVMPSNIFHIQDQRTSTQKIKKDSGVLMNMLADWWKEKQAGVVSL
jgi:hypothetical protein